MAHFSVSRNIAAPQDRVFQYLSDFRSAPQRISAIKRIEMLTDGPVGRGTRFKETRVMFGKEATEEMEVVEFNPPNGYVLGCESCGCRYRSEFRVKPAVGGTSVEMTFDAVPLTLFAKIMSKLMGFMVKSLAKSCEKDLDDIKTAIEKNAHMPA